MKHQWLAYLIVVVLAIGAGVAIAGLPNDVPVDATIVPPESTTPDTTQITESTAPDTTEPTATTEAEPTTSSTDPETTTTDAPTTVPDTTTSELALPDRSQILVVSANGAGTDGAATRMARQLEELGYAGVAPRSGTDVADFTFVYHADGFEAAAARMAADLGLLPEFVGPLVGAPRVINPPVVVELLVYVGLDFAG